MLPEMSADPALVATLQATLARRGDVRLAVLFGSQARGRARPDSDLDVAVLAEPRLDLLQLGLDLEDAVGREVQVVDLERADHVLLGAILRDGQIVYQQRAGLGGTWLARAITAWELDHPGFERMREALFQQLARRASGG